MRRSIKTDRFYAIVWVKFQLRHPVKNRTESLGTIHTQYSFPSRSCQIGIRPGSDGLICLHTRRWPIHWYPNLRRLLANAPLAIRYCTWATDGWRIRVTSEGNDRMKCRQPGSMEYRVWPALWLSGSEQSHSMIFAELNCLETKRRLLYLEIFVRSGFRRGSWMYPFSSARYLLSPQQQLGRWSSRLATGLYLMSLRAL